MCQGWLDLLDQIDQDGQAMGEKRNRDHLADNELDEELIREVDIVLDTNGNHHSAQWRVPPLVYSEGLDACR